MRAGRATPEGTDRFRRRHGNRVAAGHFRLAGGLWLSSIGLGTYLGAADDATDAAYEAAVGAALAAGVNVFDAAINYRHQRSERCLGRALERAFTGGLAARDEVFVSTKGGFVPFELEPPADPAAWVRRTYVDAGLLDPDDLCAGVHALAPRFLADQLDRSRANLGLETVDLYYLHNPETQLDGRRRPDALERISGAVDWLAEARAAGRVAAGGLATWSGLRVPPGDRSHLPLMEIQAPQEGAARLAAIQLPLNLAMPEALAAPTQELQGATLPALVVARYAGLSVFASASILQGRLARGLPSELVTAFPQLSSDAQRALQFTRSAPGITTALVGMSSPGHVRENLALTAHEPAVPEELQRLFAGGVS